MQHAVRTTIRIRKDLLDLSKLLALQKGISMQQVINETLAYGFHQLPKKKSRKEIMDEIDTIRAKVALTSEEVDELLAMNKQEQQDRVDRALGIKK